MAGVQREVLSVGIDVGTTTTQVVFSRLILHDVARPGQVPRIQVDEKSVVYRGEAHPTPLTAPDVVDAEALAALVRDEYDAAGVSPASIETGAVIITGETARTRNADAILRALSANAGDFVVTIAGPNAEAQIAGRGSGAARWSADHYEQVTSIDIGGGTSNAAVFKVGRHLCSSALAVGGRQMEIDDRGTVLRIAPPGQTIVDEFGLGLKEGRAATLEELRAFCDVMADLVVDLATGQEVRVGHGVQLTPPLTGADASSSIFLTGGIGSCYYERLPVTTLGEVARYGDVGPLLADSLHRNERLRQLNVREPPETLRATVLGAAAQTVTLSGSTIWANRDILPLRNLPVLRPALPGRGGGPPFAASVREAMARWDLDQDADAAIVVDLPTELGYPALQAVAAEIVAFHDAGHGERPLVLVLQQDYAQVLGQTIQGIRPGIPLLVVDQVGLGEGDFIDIGLPVLDGRAVPLSIKTLVFYD
ncbi:ethanolamine utilization protein EutA [Nostocoides sp. F2B08]|uniref:ethanolamine ammonia-lyase reactivating factor EutA n=1 Tax=Nostocoides sp. F2B08 TaxID=2653936 RepID=UPI001263789D|nr:ethanolamine ammonia-lyase reactivating factor EutA [Tetrasphaera sp. F2B08]KAB7744180.1 ethanolamine utilization protein EutA [Tetrasphaera sp. F2B08]